MYEEKQKNTAGAKTKKYVMVTMGSYFAKLNSLEEKN